MIAVRPAENSTTRSRPPNRCAKRWWKRARRTPAILDAPAERAAARQRRHEQPRPEKTHREPKPHPEKKTHDKPATGATTPNRAVDKSELPAFLFRKVPLAKREPQE